ncbi:MAPEG family protein [Pseudoxanthobacter sp.]|uniref:MAPEG family protein n=1 Tax=Pseudoxanthobacter sp. TaxID=1925742 RepID=UPI002FDF3B66
MSLPAVLLPVFVQVGLTFALGFWLGLARLSALKRGLVGPRDIALGEALWPRRTIQIGNCFNNQFQAPVLFYGLVALAVATGLADLAFVALSWVFVATRLVHAAIHTGPNHIGRRFLAFGAGIVALLAMWLLFAARILAGG